jgi:hypothetical protein
LGEQILHKTWFDALFDPVELARLGIEAVKGQLHFQPPLGAQVEQRLMSFLLHNLEARFWSYAWRQWAFPEAFAALLSPHFGERHTQVEWWQGLFLATTDAEAEQNSGVVGPSVIVEISLAHLPSIIPLAAFGASLTMTLLISSRNIGMTLLHLGLDVVSSVTQAAIMTTLPHTKTIETFQAKLRRAKHSGPHLLGMG